MKVWVGLAACAAVLSCRPLSETPLDANAIRDRAQFLSSEIPPRIVAASMDDLDEAVRVTASFTPDRLRSRGRQRSLEASAIPWLRSSPEGALFLNQAAPRAIARGEPAATCPAAGVSAAGAGSNGESAGQALGLCLAQLKARNTAPECTCRLLSVNSMLLASRDEFSYAPVVSAFLIGLEGGPRRTVAESLSPAEGEERVLIRDLDGPFGLLRLSGDEAWLALAEADEGQLYTGRREPFGYRRGRLAERLVLRNEAGRLLTVLIGVERRDALPASAR